MKRGEKTVSKENIYAVIGARLKELRRMRHVTQAELADMIGIKQSALANYESGNRKMPIEHLVAIAHYFRVSIDTIVSRRSESMYALALWDEAMGDVVLTDDEAYEIVAFAKYVIYKRREFE